MCAFSHQQLPQENVIISGSKCDSFILALVPHTLMLGRLSDDRNNFSPGPLYLRSAPLTRLLSVTAPHLWFPFIIFFQSFPFPPIVQINSTLHQPVSHSNLLTSSCNTLFLFLRFLFFLVPPSLPPKYTFSDHC